MRICLAQTNNQLRYDGIRFQSKEIRKDFNLNSQFTIFNSQLFKSEIKHQNMIHYTTSPLPAQRNVGQICVYLSTILKIVIYYICGIMDLNGRARFRAGPGGISVWMIFLKRSP